MNRRDFVHARPRVRKPPLLQIIGLSIMAAAAFAWLDLSGEPRYQGRPLSRWLDDLPELLDTEYHSESSLPARHALQHMGTNAIPFLLSRLRTHDSPFRQKLLGAAERAGLIDFPFHRDAYRQEQAARGFRLLGPQAVSVVPELVALLNGTNSSSGWHAAYALAGIGPDGVAPLAAALTNHNSDVRRRAVFAFSRLHGIEAQTNWIPGNN